MSHTPNFFAATYIFFRKGSQILLSKRQNTGWHDGDYSLPSGHIDDGENAAECGIREAKEEVCVDVKLEDLIFAHCAERHDGDRRKYFDVYYFVEKWQGDLKNGEPEKCSEIEWFDVDKIPTNTIPFIKEVLERANKQIRFSIIYNE